MARGCVPRSGPGRALRVPLRTTRISRTAPLLTDGTGPLYREAARDDLDTLAERAARALDW